MTEATAPTFTDNPFDDKPYNEIVKALKTSNVLGLHIAIVRDIEGQDEPLAFSYPIGTSDGETKLSYEETFPLGDSTQLITLVALSKALESKGYDLSTPLQTIFPELKMAEEGVESKINSIDILTHMTGLPDLKDGEVGQINAANILEKLATIQPVHPFRSQRLYSTTPFYLVECVIEKLTSRDFVSFVQDEILNRWKMRFTTFEEGNPSKAANGLCSNSRDLLKLHLAFSQILDDFFANHIKDNTKEAKRGFIKASHEGIPTYEISSSDGRYGNMTIVLPDHKTRISVIYKKGNLVNVDKDRDGEGEDFGAWLRGRMIEHFGSLAGQL